MVDNGIVTLERVYLDNTKIDAKSNKYSFVWKKTVERNRAKLLAEPDELWEYYTKICTQEEKESLREEKIMEMDEQQRKDLVKKICKEIRKDPNASEELKKKASKAGKHP